MFLLNVSLRWSRYHVLEADGCESALAALNSMLSWDEFLNRITTTSYVTPQDLGPETSFAQPLKVGTDALLHPADQAAAGAAAFQGGTLGKADGVDPPQPSLLLT